MTTLASRLNALIKEKGITQSQFADMVGIKQPSAQKVLSGETKRPRNLVDMARVLGVDPIWLQSGVGSSEVKSADVSTHPTPERIKNSNTVIIDDTANENSSIVLTAYHRLAGGDGYLNNDYPDEIRSIEFSPDKFVELFGRKTAKNLALCVVDGNSMYDPDDPVGSLKNGDYVCIDTSVTQFVSDGIYSFTFEGYEKIKRLQHLSGNRIKVISDNPRYEDEIIEGEKLAELYIRGKFFKKIVFDLIDI